MGMIGNTLAQGLISGANIQDGTVDTADIKSNAITPSKLSIGGLTWDSNSNVGIGVTPSAWGGGQVGLQVKNASLSGFSNSAYVMANTYYDGTSEKYIASSFAAKYAQASGAHIWYTAPSGTAGNAITFTQAMTLGANGFLGIGQTSPAWAVDILADTGNLLVHQTRARVIDAERNIGGIIGSGYSTGTTIVDAAQITFASTGAWSSTSTPSYIAFGTTASGSTSTTERARIDSSGNLLVGTTTLGFSAKSQFVLDGGSATNSTPNNAGVLVSRTTGASGESLALRVKSGAGISGTTFPAQVVSAGNNVFEFYTTGAAPIVFGTNSTERARITAAGEFLINTTSNGFSGSVLIYANSALRNAVVCVDTGTTYGNNYYYQWFVNAAGNSAGSISHTASTTIAFLTSSDKRLKHNIVDAPSALQKVNDVKVCSFDWIEDGHHVDYGFIAQDLYKVIPEAVGKGDDAETIEDPKGTWQVEYGRLTPILFKAIQEQQAIIEQLETRLAALEGA